jgi:hypothetical protein
VKPLALAMGSSYSKLVKNNLTKMQTINPTKLVLTMNRIEEEKAF